MSPNAQMLIMMVAIFAIFYFFMIRPQQKRQKEIQKFQNSLYGTVKEVDLANNIVEVEIARGVVIRVNKGHVFKDEASTPATK